jgi:hypothetical protein
MQVQINDQFMDVEEAKSLRIHVPGTEWTLTYFGHRVDEMDIRIDRTG